MFPILGDGELSTGPGPYGGRLSVVRASVFGDEALSTDPQDGIHGSE